MENFILEISGKTFENEMGMTYKFNQEMGLITVNNGETTNVVKHSFYEKEGKIYVKIMGEAEDLNVNILSKKPVSFTMKKANGNEPYGTMKEISN